MGVRSWQRAAVLQQAGGLGLGPLQAAAWHPRRSCYLPAAHSHFHQQHSSHVPQQRCSWRSRRAGGSRCIVRVVAEPQAALAGPNESPPVVQPTEVVAPPASINLQEQIETLERYWNRGLPDQSMAEAAKEAITIIKTTVQDAVNTKFPGLRGLQSTVASSGALQPIVHVAQSGQYAPAYEALQILCYRNNVTCKTVGASGIVDRVATNLGQTDDLELKCAELYLLTSLAAFCDATHERIINAGLVPMLVSMCRGASDMQHVGVGTKQATVQSRAAAVLRNLAHNTRNHGLLINAGAVDALVHILRHEQDPASRINAAVAVACLVGHEEGNPKLQLSEDLVVEMLQVLHAACSGAMVHGTFWTVWKLCQGLASLTVNDRNKELITAHNGVAILAEVLFGKHHNNEAAHRFALSALWNLAFHEGSRMDIIRTPGLVDAIRHTLATTESSRTKEVAKGALWTLGLEDDVRSLYDARIANGVSSSSEDEDAGRQGVHAGPHVPHVMLSYEWGCQQTVMLIKTELQRAGYATWMDIDKMSGSTLEAMARAVEDSAAVLVCVSKKYKESQACRTEAEYAFQQRKKIIPLLLERDYKPSGWLGALMGTRLYFALHDPRQLPAKMPQLIKELGDAGKLPAAGGVVSIHTDGSRPLAISAERPELWSHLEVEEWLKRVRCAEYVNAFRDKDMDGCALSGLYRMSTDAKFIHETLATEFGMHVLGHRLRLIEELTRLFS